jgi:hypothetical protein
MIVDRGTVYAVWCRGGRTRDLGVQLVESDVYIGVIGLRYGSTVPDEPDFSYTELKFKMATEVGIPRLVFLLDESAELAGRIPGDGAARSRQNRFRSHLLSAEVIVGTSRTPDDLVRAVLHGLLESRDTHSDRPTELGRQRLPWMVPPRTGPVIPRPAVTEQLLSLLTAPDTAKVGLTTALLARVGESGLDLFRGSACGGG